MSARRKLTGHTIVARSAAALVALVAGAASFTHIISVALDAGEHVAGAVALPLAIDGLIVVGVSALLEDKRAGLQPRFIARVAVAVGVVATLAANLASAQPTMTGRLVAIAAPVAFLLSVEVLTRSGKPRASEVAEPVAVAEVAAPALTVKSQPTEVPPSGHGRTEAPRRGEAAVKVAAAMATAPEASVAELARIAGVSRSTVRRVRPEVVAAGG